MFNRRAVGRATVSATFGSSLRAGLLRHIREPTQIVIVAMTSGSLRHKQPVNIDAKVFARVVCVCVNMSLALVPAVSAYSLELLASSGRLGKPGIEIPWEGRCSWKSRMRWEHSKDEADKERERDVPALH